MARETLAMAIAPSSWMEDDGSVGFVAYAGAMVDRYDWTTGQSYKMQLMVTPEAIDLGRFAGGAAPFLDAHESDEVGCVLGVVLPDTIEIMDGQLRCRVKLSVNPDNAGIVADIKAGVLRNCSVGFDILASEVMEATATTPKVVTVTRWQPFELSLVAVGADPKAQSFHKAEEGQKMNEIKHPATPSVDVEALRAEGARNERERLAAIDTAAKATKAPAELVSQLKANGTSADEARRQLLDRAAAVSDAVDTAPAARFEVGPTAGEKLRSGVVSALLAKANPGKAAFALTGEGQRFVGRRTADIARMYLAAMGHDVTTLNDAGAIKRAFFAHSTSDMPDLLGDAIGKSLLAAYAELPAQYQSFCAQVPFSGIYDYKPIVMSGVSAIGDVPEGSDYPEIALKESQETVSQNKGGQIVAISLEMLLKDNLDGLSRLPAAQAAAARRREHQKIADILNANSGTGKTMADSQHLFAAAHANIKATGVGAAPSASSLDATEQLIGKQTGLNGELLGLEGAVIVVPRALRNTAEQLFSPRYMPTQASGALTPSQLSMQVQAFNWLTSDIQWYVFANPAIAPVIVYGYPDNTDPLSLSIEDSFGNDTRKYKVTHWFGAGVADFRGAALNQGA